MESTCDRWNWRQVLPPEFINEGWGRDLSEALLCILYSGFLKLQLMANFTPLEILYYRKTPLNYTG